MCMKQEADSQKSVAEESGSDTFKYEGHIQKIKKSEEL